MCRLYSEPGNCATNPAKTFEAHTEWTLYARSGDDPFACHKDITRLCGGIDFTTQVRFPPDSDSVDLGLSAEVLNEDTAGARFVFLAKYMKFKHSELDLEQLVHAPIASFDGTVYFLLQNRIYGPGDHTTTSGHALPYVPSGDSGGHSKCFLNTATRGASQAGVCLRDYDAAEGIIKCTHADQRGKYHIAAPLNTRVFVEVTYSGHKFRLVDDAIADSVNIKLLPTNTTVNGAGTAALAGHSHVIAVTGDISNADLQDTAGQIVQLGAHGTRCRYSVAEEAIFTTRIPVASYICQPSNEVPYAWARRFSELGVESKRERKDERARARARVCVCVCVCVWQGVESARERARGRWGKQEGGWRERET